MRKWALLQIRLETRQTFYLFFVSGFQKSTNHGFCESSQKERVAVIPIENKRLEAGIDYVVGNF